MQNQPTALVYPPSPPQPTILAHLSSLPQHEKELANIKFREIAEANEVLSDAEKRGRYDRGEDVSGQQQQGQQGHPGFPGGFHPFGGGGGFNFQFRQG